MAAALLHRTPSVRCMTRARGEEGSRVGAPMVRACGSARSADALAGLETLYATGSGVTEDAEQPASLMRRAADAGSVLGQMWLGIMYAQGKGLPQNEVTGLSWLYLARSILWRRVPVIFEEVRHGLEAQLLLRVDGSALGGTPGVCEHSGFRNVTVNLLSSSARAISPIRNELLSHGISRPESGIRDRRAYSN